MPDVGGKKYSYTKKGKAAAKKVAEAGKATVRVGGFAAGKGIGASGVARSGLKKAAARGPMYKAGANMGAMAGKGAVDRKMLKKASNRDAVTKKSSKVY